MQPLRELVIPMGLKDISVCQNQHILLAVVYNSVRIYDMHLKAPYICIELDETPKAARLSPCGRYFYIHNSDNEIHLYDAKQGTIVQSISSVPNLTKTIKFSKNSQKLILGSTQMLCLWNIRKCSIDVRTQLWRNISCYDVNKEGTQFVIGTYQGTVYVLDFISVGSCTQAQIKKHKSRVAAVCCHEQKIVSVSDDGYFLVSTITKDVNDQKIIEYREMKIKTIPKDIESVGNNFYMFNPDGLTWFSYKNGLTLTGFTDYKYYRPLNNQDGQLMFVSMSNGEIQWWLSTTFKTTSEIQRQKSQKRKKNELEKENEQSGLNEGKNQSGKINNTRNWARARGQVTY